MQNNSPPSATTGAAPRRVSRPQTLQIDHSTGEWVPDVVLDEPGSDSPVQSKIQPKSPPSSAAAPAPAGGVPAVITSTASPMNNPSGSNQQTVQSPSRPRSHTHPYTPVLKSPCFVHSNLDKGASLSDWLNQSRKAQQSPHHFHQPKDMAVMGPAHYRSSSEDYSEDTEDDSSSLTRQLAETAVSVREMSKQLGRARVRSNLQSVLIITKARDNRLIKLTRELALYLMLKPGANGRGLVVYVDNQLRESKRFDAAGIERDHPELFVPAPRRRSSSSNSISSMSSFTEISGNGIDNTEGQLRYWTSDMCRKTPQLFDFVVTLGGDGTVLFTSWLFQSIVPPVLPFALGSLGFLTNFDFADHRSVMDTVIDSGIRVNLRMRFTCTVYRAVAPEKGKGRRAVKKGETGEIIMKNVEKGGWEALESGYSGTGTAGSAKDKEVMCFTTRPVESFEVLNDLVVDRGPSPYVSLLELFGDEQHMTTVQADGLTVSTPTGSTAYSLSAGGSLVHPEIPALLITPICPHTLSFRPMLLPDTMELRICVPFNSRSTAWASFDGRGRVELKQGDHIKVTASKFPFPTVCAVNQSTDWFSSISRTLKWNERERQKSFVVVEEGPAAPGTDQSGGEEVEEEEEEEEDKFDIDDSSPENAASAAVPKPPRSPIASKVRTPRATKVELSPDVRISHHGQTSPDRYHPSSTLPQSHVHAHAHFTPPESPHGAAHRMQGENGDRDHIHNPRGMQGTKSKIPANRDLESENMRTPRPDDLMTKTQDRLHHRMHRHRHPAQKRNRSLDLGARRAFAVWGQDDTDDSSAGDSDVGQ